MYSYFRAPGSQFTYNQVQTKLPAWKLIVNRDLMSHMAQVKEIFLSIICCYVDFEVKRKKQKNKYIVLRATET